MEYGSVSGKECERDVYTADFSTQLPFNAASYLFFCFVFFFGQIEYVRVEWTKE